MFISLICLTPAASIRDLIQINKSTELIKRNKRIIMFRCSVKTPAAVSIRYFIQRHVTCKVLPAVFKMNAKRNKRRLEIEVTGPVSQPNGDLHRLTEQAFWLKVQIPNEISRLK